MNSILLYSCANAAYSDFAALFAMSAVMNIPDAKAEVGVEVVDDASKLVNEMFPDKVLIKPMKFTRSIDAPIMRMITQPVMKAKYVYISDIDFIFFDKKMVKQHLDNMAKTELPYSNSVRIGEPNLRMSGLHFSEYDAYYPVDIPDPLPETDETTLYEIIRAKFGVFPKEWFRPVHGIHLSQNREPQGNPGWGIEPFMNDWITFSNTKEFAMAYPLLSHRVKNCLVKINDVWLSTQK